MTKHLSIVPDKGSDGLQKPLPPEEKLRLVQKVIHSVLQDAQSTWADLWQELQGEAGSGRVTPPDVDKRFQPGCGWAEFLEKMWLLKHHIDYAKRLSGGEL